MLNKANAIYNFFGEEKQRLKAREEYHELEVALHELAKFNIKNIGLKLIPSDLINNCNEELADNVLLCMQLNKKDFEESWEKLTNSYSQNRILHCYGIENFYFDKEKVRQTVIKKIDRTIQRFNINTNLMTQEEFLRVLGSEE